MNKTIIHVGLVTLLFSKSMCHKYIIIAAIFIFIQSSCYSPNKPITLEKERAITDVDSNLTNNDVQSFTNAYDRADTTGSYAIKDTVRTGNFTYKIHGIGYNKTLGSDSYEKRADGIYLVFWLWYTNNSSTTLTLDNSEFKLVDSHGNEYDFSREGSTALEISGDHTIASKECSPQVRKLAYLCFEVPRRATYYLLVPSKIELGTTASIRIPGNKKLW